MPASSDVDDAEGRKWHERNTGRSLRTLLVGLVWVAFAGFSVLDAPPYAQNEFWAAAGFSAVGALYVAVFVSDRVRAIRRRMLTSGVLWGLLALVALACSLYWYVLVPDYVLAAGALLFSAVTTLKSLQERSLACNRCVQAVVFAGSAGLFVVGLSVRTLGTKPSILALALVGVTTGLVGMLFVPRFLWE
ncbi:hypothetical protein [Halorussus halophilus]|uniref:hypothetical protein n=1 Tax=Halorussus halophilus TaxID=2650975 RepID=UPI001300CA6D|nr:hypothetical protein [Halorussus halophilus]